MKNLTIIIIATVIALSSITFSIAKTLQQNESFTVGAGGTLYLDTDMGSIDIESHDRDTVEVAIYRKRLSESEFEVTFTQDGDDLRVNGEKNGIGSFFSFGSLGVRFQIKVPNRYDLNLKTSGGSIELSDLNGKVNAYTSGGSITLGKIVGDVDVKTSGGSIKVEEVVGNISGHTSGGSIRVKMSQQPTEDSRLTTSGGSITAYLISSIAVDLEAKTSGGSVSSDFDVNGKLKSKKLKGTINGGGPEMYLKTSGGSVRIKKL